MCHDGYSRLTANRTPSHFSKAHMRAENCILTSLQCFWQPVTCAPEACISHYSHQLERNASTTRLICDFKKKFLFNFYFVGPPGYSNFL